MTGDERSVLHIAGARPNFPKLGPVWRALERRGVRQTLIHTGQHYDDSLSDSFFRDLDLPTPRLNLGIGSGSHAQQTASLISALERPIAELKPSIVVLYGDINSTLGGAVVCAKLNIPTAHVEAGLRSFDRSMPEEINRVLVDTLADLLFATSPDAVANLAREGVRPGSIHFVGNPMVDSLLHALPRLDAQTAQELTRGLESYAVVTLHRPANVDQDASAAESVAMLDELSRLVPVILPLHPRGKQQLESAGLSDLTRVRMVEPLSYLRFLALVREASLVVTDSGGIQEETTALGIPCITMRPNTERPVTITHGTNRLADPQDVARLAGVALSGLWQTPHEPPPLWDGRAGERIAALVEDFLAKSLR